MGRVKIPMKRISENRKRNITLIGRKNSLVNKARELGTLCDVNVSMIIFSDHRQNAEIFPQDPLHLNDMIKHYKSIRAKIPRKIQSYGLSDFIKDRKNNIEKELEKAKKENLEAKYPTWFDSLDKSSPSELYDLVSVLGKKINKVRARIDLLKSTKTSKISNLDAQVSLMMPIFDPTPIRMMTPIDYSSSFRPDDRLASDRSSNTNVDNVYHPVMLMGQDIGGYDHYKRSMQPLDSKSTTTTSEDDQDKRSMQSLDSKSTVTMSEDDQESLDSKSTATTSEDDQKSLDSKSNGTTSEDDEDKRSSLDSKSTATTSEDDEDKRFMQSLDSKSTATTSEDGSSSYDGANSGLQPEVPQCKDTLSCYCD